MTSLNVIFEDDHILVVDKPSGVIVNRSDTATEGTVQDEVAGMIDSADEESEYFQRGGIVHRLDKDTSGVLVIAKDERSFKVLQKQFKRREVKKEYRAIVIGDLADEEFEVNAPIKRNPRNRFKYAVLADGKDAVTRGRKVDSFEKDGLKFTVLDIFPLTGRTHQIRVHLGAMGFPVAGDRLYSARKQQETIAAVFPRLMLHAVKLTLVHPITSEQLTFESSLPSEFVI
jgi:23S rRNA pseudouridine1911/1915/1917 synthase